MTNENATPALPLGAFLLALVIRPVKALAQVVESAKPTWLIPVAAALAMIWLTPILTVPILQKEAAASIDASIEMMGGEDMSPEMRAQMEQSRVFSTNPLFLVATSGITETVMLPILLLSGAGVLYLLGLVMGGHSSFGAVFRMSAWATVAETIGRIFLLIGTMAAGATRLPGLQSLVQRSVSEVIASPATAGLAVVLGKISLFDIWYLVLIAAGMVAACQISRWKGAAAAVLFWILSLIPPVAMAMIGNMVAASFMGS